MLNHLELNVRDDILNLDSNWSLALANVNTFKQTLKPRRAECCSCSLNPMALHASEHGHPPQAGPAKQLKIKEHHCHSV